MSFPVLLTLNLSTDDQPLREYLRMDAPLPTHPVQKVICENPRYADALYHAWARRKIANGKTCGGGWWERYCSPRVSGNRRDA